jgi:hypothetical protein
MRAITTKDYIVVISLFVLMIGHIALNFQFTWIVLALEVIVIFYASTNSQVSLLFAWYDIWVGAFWDKKAHWLYILPIPMCGIILKFRPKSGLILQDRIAYNMDNRIYKQYLLEDKHGHALTHWATSEHEAYVLAWKNRSIK